MKVFTVLLGVMLCASLSATDFVPEVFMATETHIVRTTKLGDMAPQTMVDRSGAFGLSVAVHADKVYWSESGTNGVYRANLDGSEAALWLSTSGEPFSLAIEPVTEGLFWYHENHIYRAGLDNGAATIVVTSGPIGAIALDAVNGKVYWLEKDSGALMRATLDGTAIEELTPAGLPFTTTEHSSTAAIAVAPDALYFAGACYDYPASRIYKTDLDGTYWEEVYAIDYGEIVAAMYYHAQDDMLYYYEYFPEDQPYHLFQYMPSSAYRDSAVTWREHAPEGDVPGDPLLAGRRNFAVQPGGTQPVVWFVDAAGVNKKALPRTTLITPVTMEVADLKVVYEDNAATGRIYWSEMLSHILPYSSAIYSINTDGSNRQTVVPETSVAFGIAVDTENGYVYWIESFEQQISRVDLSTGATSRVVRTHSFWGYPVGLVLDHESDILYYTLFYNGASGAIASYDLSTESSSVVAVLNHYAPWDIALDVHEQTLYFTAGNDVYRCGTDGAHIRPIDGLRGYSIYLDAAGGKVYAARGGKLRRTSLDGAELEELGSLPLSEFNTIALGAPAQSLALVGPPQAAVGDSVTLRVGALPPLTGTVIYEWYKEGVLIDGAYRSEYRIPSVTHADAGEYQLRIVDESKGVHLSDPFILTVVEAVPVPAAGLVSLGVLLCALLLLGIPKIYVRIKS